MGIKLTINKGHIPVHIWTEDIQSAALDQLINIAQLPFVHHHIAAMPDVHAGIGATVGAVIPTHQAIIPAAVGVDIGCGMIAAKLNLSAHQLPDNLAKMRADIEAQIPVGFAVHKESAIRKEAVKRLKTDYDALTDKHPILYKRQKDKLSWAKQIGSLGGGNHFIEVCLDESQNVWLMLHSGSRGIGNLIGRYFISLAREEMLKNNVHLPDKDLAYFSEGSSHFNDYVEAVNWAQAYAAENRAQMLALMTQSIAPHLPTFKIVGHAVNCHHNYVQKEMHFGKTVYLTRKGAIRAGVGELGIIPGSMGAKSFIVKGKGNTEAFCSCSHGAGRRMSRTQAKKVFSVDDLKKQTEGVECRKDKGVIDESPGAYKDIDQVMENQSDLVEIVHTLKQVICVKG